MYCATTVGSLASADSKSFQNVLHAITSIVYMVGLRISITAPRGLREAGGIYGVDKCYNYYQSPMLIMQCRENTNHIL